MPFFIKRITRFTESVYLVEAPDAETAKTADGEYLGYTDVDIAADHLIACGPDGNTEGSSERDITEVNAVSGPFETEDAARESDDAGVEDS